MLDRKRQLLMIGLVAVGLCGPAQAADLRVGVYGGTGQKGILEGLAQSESIDAGPVDRFTAFNLSHCDVVVWPHGRLAAGDRARLWRVLLKEYVKAGGGLILTHDAAGGAGPRRGDMGEEPLFGDIARSPGYPARKDKRVFKRSPDTDHPLAAALPAVFSHAYYDHMALITGTGGTTVMVDEDGDPVVVVGEVGRGRVVVMGNLPGYEGVRTTDPVTKMLHSTDNDAPLAGAELTMLVAALKWAGEPFHEKRVLPIELETTLDAAEARALQAGAIRKEPIAVFFDRIESNRLDLNTWQYATEGPGVNKWGTWFGHGIVGPPYDMFIETTSANTPLTSRRFEQSPVENKFLFTGEAILSTMFAGALEWRVLDASNNGYGVRLVYGGLAAEDPGVGLREDHREHHVKIGDSRHAILKITAGKAVALTVVAAPGRLMSPPREAAPEKRVPTRFQRAEDGGLTLSIDGMVVARARDDAYDRFTQLQAVMTTPDGRLGFDNPKLTGYFAADSARLFAPRPWIVPEPKEMTGNGETFALRDGAQFVVSDKSKIDTYLLDEWIIPEIEGYHGIKMMAVTFEEVDESRPAVYLGTASDPAFANVFDAALREVNEKDPGPEGYAILVTQDRAQAAGATERGTFWALQSLVQLIERKDGIVRLRGVRVRDWPDFELRGGLTYLGKPQFEPRLPAAQRMVRFMARLKFNAWAVGNPRMDFPSYNVSGYGCRWNFKQMIALFEYAERHHIQVIPHVPSLSHSGWKVVTYLSRSNPTLWQRMLDEKVLIEPLGNYHHDALNPLSPLAWDMVKSTTEDIINAFPSAEIVFASTQDEICPPLNTHAPERNNEDLLVEWIGKHHKLLKGRGVRMMMYCDYLLEAGKFPGSCATSGGRSYGGMVSHGAIDRIPKDIILVDWYYGTLPSRPGYQYMRDKGFDVVAMPGSNYGYAHESAYYAAREGKKAGLLGIIRHGHPLEQYQNPRWAYTLPWIYGWTVPAKMIPDWNWQEDWQELYQGPLPSHTGPVQPVDITRACNDSRSDDKSDDGKGWLDYGRGAALRDLPPGELVYKRYRFTIVDEDANDGKSVVLVSSTRESTDEATRKVSVPVNTKARSLVFLHAASSMGGAMGWQNVGLYRVNYADGTSAVIPLCYGHNIGPWIFSVEPGQRNNNFFKDGHLSWTRLAHEGRTAAGDKTGLYSYEWVNPESDKTVSSIDVELTTDGDLRVALVALSAVRQAADTPGN